MKLTIDIDSTDIEKAIHIEIAKAVSALTTEALQAKIDEVIAIKFARITDSKVDSILKESISARISSQYSDFQIKNHIITALATAARDLIKGKA